MPPPACSFSARCVALGEGSVDVGGAFRETLTLAAYDLMSGAVPLFIPCPNNVHGVGLNRDRRILNPSATSPLALAMLNFVGVLMGVACRTRFPLPLFLPAIVWKQILHEPLQVCVRAVCSQRGQAAPLQWWVSVCAAVGGRRGCAPVCHFPAVCGHCVIRKVTWRRLTSCLCRG